MKNGKRKSTTLQQNNYKLNQNNTFHSRNSLFLIHNYKNLHFFCIFLRFFLHTSKKSSNFAPSNVESRQRNLT